MQPGHESPLAGATHVPRTHGGVSPAPLGDLGGRGQRQCCLEDRELDQLLGCGADPLLLGELQ